VPRSFRLCAFHAAAAAGLVIELDVPLGPFTWVDAVGKNKLAVESVTLNGGPDCRRAGADARQMNRDEAHFSIGFELGTWLMNVSAVTATTGAWLMRRWSRDIVNRNVRSRSVQLLRCAESRRRRSLSRCLRRQVFHMRLAFISNVDRRQPIGCKRCQQAEGQKKPAEAGFRFEISVAPSRMHSPAHYPYYRD
jgi:hypothetical protein